MAWSALDWPAAGPCLATLRLDESKARPFQGTARPEHHRPARGPVQVQPKATIPGEMNQSHAPDSVSDFFHTDYPARREN